MSGYTADVIAHQGILDEGVSFVSKPFSMNALAEKVREVLRMMRNRRRNVDPVPASLSTSILPRIRKRCSGRPQGSGQPLSGNDWAERSGAHSPLVVKNGVKILERFSEGCRNRYRSLQETRSQERSPSAV